MDILSKGLTVLQYRKTPGLGLGSESSSQTHIKSLGIQGTRDPSSEFFGSVVQFIKDISPQKKIKIYGFLISYSERA
jgi:hypothetical protein